MSPKTAKAADEQDAYWGVLSGGEGGLGIIFPVAEEHAKGRH